MGRLALLADEAHCSFSVSLLLSLLLLLVSLSLVVVVSRSNGRLALLADLPEAGGVGVGRDALEDDLRRDQTNMYVYVYVCVYVCLHIYIYIYMHVYKYIQYNIINMFYNNKNNNMFRFHIMCAYARFRGRPASCRRGAGRR